MILRQVHLEGVNVIKVGTFKYEWVVIIDPIRPSIPPFTIYVTLVHMCH